MCTFGDLSCVSVDGGLTEQEVRCVPLGLNPVLVFSCVLRKMCQM